LGWRREKKSQLFKGGFSCFLTQKREENEGDFYYTHTYIYIYMNITSLKLRFNNQQSFYYKLPRIVDKGTDQKKCRFKKDQYFPGTQTRFLF